MNRALPSARASKCSAAPSGGALHARGPTSTGQCMHEFTLCAGPMCFESSRCARPSSRTDERHALLCAKPNLDPNPNPTPDSLSSCSFCRSSRKDDGVGFRFGRTSVQRLTHACTRIHARHHPLTPTATFHPAHTRHRPPMPAIPVRAGGFVAPVTCALDATRLEAAPHHAH